jgi:hypothetical protein
MLNPSRVTFLAPSSTPWRKKNLKPWLIKVTATLVLVVFATVSLHGHWPLALALVCCGIGFWWVNDVWQHYCERMDMLEEVDAMTSSEFTQYAAELLRTQGYSLVTAGRVAKPPADLLLSRGKESVACWIHHKRSPVPVELVARATATAQAWPGWRAMVFASQRCTAAAWYRARREGCLFSNRSSLANLVAQHRRGHRVIAFPYEETARLRSRK